MWTEPYTSTECSPKCRVKRHDGVLVTIKYITDTIVLHFPLVGIFQNVSRYASCLVICSNRLLVDVCLHWTITDRSHAQAISVIKTFYINKKSASIIKKKIFCVWQDWDCTVNLQLHWILNHIRKKRSFFLRNILSQGEYKFHNLKCFCTHLFD